MYIFYCAEWYNRPERWIAIEVKVCDHDLLDYAALDDTYFQMQYLSLYYLIYFDLYLLQIQIYCCNINSIKYSKLHREK
jgi:hypothetical protein